MTTTIFWRFGRNKVNRCISTLYIYNTYYKSLVYILPLFYELFIRGRIAAVGTRMTRSEIRWSGPEVLTKYSVPATGARRTWIINPEAEIPSEHTGTRMPEQVVQASP